MTSTLTRWVENYDRALTFFRAFRAWWPANSMQQLFEIHEEQLRGRLPGIAVPARERILAQIEMARAEMLVVTSTPGEINLLGGPLGARLEHRAAVVMVLDDDTKEWLNDQILLGRIRHAETLMFEWYCPDMPETGVDGKAGTGIVASRIVRPAALVDGDAVEDLGTIGDQLTANELWEIFPVKPNVAMRLHEGWLVTIYAKDFGPSDLFADLRECAIARQEMNDAYRAAAEDADEDADEVREGQC
jgi:hypothetical protein